MDQWLVRTSKNVISGPYTQEKVCQLIHDGELGLQDEVCPANGYWIFLHEREEVERQLGIQVRASKTEDDITQTQTETETELNQAIPSPDGTTVHAIRGGAGAAAAQAAENTSPRGLEAASFWRGFAWFLAIAACIIVIVVLKVLRAE